MTPESDVLPAGTVVGEFEVVRLLGVGGFGMTYLARETQLGRRVGDEGVPPPRLGRAASRRDDRTAVCSARGRFPVGAGALPRRGAHSGAVRPSAPRAGAPGVSRRVAVPTW